MDLTNPDPLILRQIYAIATDHGPLSGVPRAACSVRTASFYRRNGREVTVTERVSADDWTGLYAARLRFADLHQRHSKYTYTTEFTGTCE